MRCNMCSKIGVKLAANQSAAEQIKPAANLGSLLITSLLFLMTPANDREPIEL